MELQLVAGTYSICRMPPDSSVDEAATPELYSVTRTPEETSVVCRAGAEPIGATIERDWRALRVVGVLDFAMIGVLSELTGALAEAAVTLFAVSTFDTDYLLVKDRDLARAATALAARGHEVLGL